MTQKSVTFQAIKWEVEESDESVTIHIHGLNRQNKRVTVKIPDFKPYVYLELDANIKWTDARLELLRAFLRKSLHVNYPVKNKLVDRKKNYYYKPAKFLWMAFNTNAGIRALERAVRGQFILYGVGNIRLKVHEKSANPILQLFAMRKVKPAGWIVAKRTTKNTLLQEYCNVFSTSDIEIVSSFRDISPAKDVSHVTNPLIVSYDLECISGDASGNTFPSPTRKTDQIICISATVAYSQDDTSKWKTYCLVNEADDKKCPHNLEDGSEVRHFNSEKELLLGWTDFINEIDPDVITGYNTLAFDDNYMCERANSRLCWPKFSKMGRLIGQRSKTDERHWSSSAYGDQRFTYIDIPGRLHIDMYPVIFKDYNNLMSYKLDFVSEYFLDDHKIDLPPKEMIQLWHRGEEEDIRKIVTYCNKDTYLPLKLFQHLNTWLGLTEMANVMMVPMFDLITRGQQIRVFSQVYCLSFDLDVVTTDRWADYHPTDSEKEFVGATVQNPMCGYWELVATYDFKSLYPTTIMAYNLCFSTYVPDDEDPPADQYHDIQFSSHYGCEHDTAIRKSKVKKHICKDHHYRFYKAEVKKGIIPMLVENLLDARAITKEEMKKLSGKLKDKNLTKVEEKQLKLKMGVLDKRQNGYKISANSVSGDTPVPCKINGYFQYKTIEELSSVWKNDNNGNQVSQLQGVLVWSDIGWTLVRYIIRHPVTKPLKRISTDTAVVDCTEEHSLLTATRTPVKPVDLRRGDELLHCDIPNPSDTPLLVRELNKSFDTALEETAFTHGIFHSNGMCNGSGEWCISHNDHGILQRVTKYLNGKFSISRSRVYNMLENSNDNRGKKMYYLHVVGKESCKIIARVYHKIFYDSRGSKRVPQYIFSAPFNVRLAFLLGYCATDTLNKEFTITASSQIGAAGLIYLAKTLGYHVTVQVQDRTFHLKLCNGHQNNYVQGIDLSPEPLPLHNEKYVEYVYDLETVSHHFAAGVGNMIVHNSMYGGFGSDYSYAPFYEAAACTTAMGRKSIQDAIDFAKKYRPDTMLVYGDSVTKDTPVLLRDSKGKVSVQQISHIAKEFEWSLYHDFKSSFIEPINSSIEYHVAEDGGEALMAARHMFNSEKRWKKECKKMCGWEVWTDSGWSDIKQVIRHKTRKKIFRVETSAGIVDVTQDHSLLTADKKQIKPVNVRRGVMLLHNKFTEFTEQETTLTDTEASMWGVFMACGECIDEWYIKDTDRDLLELIAVWLETIERIKFKVLKCDSGYILIPTILNRKLIDKYSVMYDDSYTKIVPEVILNAPRDIKTAFWGGYCTGCAVGSLKDFMMKTNNKITAASLWYLARSIGYENICLQSRKNEIRIQTYDVLRSGTAVKKITSIGNADDYVYDLETASGCFQAGVGEMIVKNTDSCMLKFTSVRNLKECFDICKDLEKKINAIFPKPMYLELEKIYSKYFLLSKKRYVGYIVDSDGNLLEVDKKGVVIKRRDNCAYLREIYSVLIDMVMDKKPKWMVYEYLCGKIKDLLNGEVDLMKLVVTKSIKDNYKTQNLPHVAVAKKMRERGKYVASGTRIQYVFTVTEHKNDPQYIKAEDPDHYLKNTDTLEIDYLYYFEKQLVNPIDEVLHVKFGVENILKNLLRLLKKGAIKNATEYFYPKFKVL